MAFDKTLCAYCNDPLGVGDHGFCLKRLQCGAPSDRRDPWTSFSITKIKRTVRRVAKRGSKRCQVCNGEFTHKGKYCSTACTGKAYRDRKATSEGRSVKVGAPRVRANRKAVAA